MTDCTDCSENLRDVWKGNWNCPGCRARMLMRLPAKVHRDGWIKKWRNDGEDLMVNAVVDGLRKMENMTHG